MPRRLRLPYTDATYGVRNSEEIGPMRYMLMLHAPRGTGDYAITQWSPDALKAHMQFMHELNKDLIAAGERVDAQGLAAPGGARIVRADAKGLPVVTDGPVAEAKESLARYWIVDVATAARAYAVAGRAWAAPGPNGKPRNPKTE